jgi:hypothetical protein
MDTASKIQIGILAVLTATLIATLWQVRLQNRLQKAQLLRNRFEMYWRLYDPVPEDLVEWMELVPEDFMPRKRYEAEYSGSPARMKKYVGLAKTYEYLAFAFTMREFGPDPLGSDWTERWVRDLLDEEQFVQINEHYADYYPDFSRHVRELRKATSAD